MSHFPKTKILLLALALSMTSCASLRTQPPDTDINALLRERGGPSLEWSQLQGKPADNDAINDWLLSPIGPDTAIRIAMLRSPKLQREYARLGLARADVLEAVEIGNPRISLLRQNISPGEGIQRGAGIFIASDRFDSAAFENKACTG